MAVLTKTEIRQKMKELKELSFVGELIYVESEQVVIITLNPRLNQLLSVTRCIWTLQIEKLTKEAIHQYYQQRVIDYLQDAITLAKELQTADYKRIS
ncbi:hypothetical protein [Spirosoma gilvum]